MERWGSAALEQWLYHSTTPSLRTPVAPYCSAASYESGSVP